MLISRYNECREKKIYFITYQDVLKRKCCIIVGKICPKLEGFSVKD